MFTLTISTANDAFGEHWADRDGEVARILRELAQHIEDKGAASEVGALRDANGNTVGEWRYQDE